MPISSPPARPRPTRLQRSAAFAGFHLPNCVPLLIALLAATSCAWAYCERCRGIGRIACTSCAGKWQRVTHAVPCTRQAGGCDGRGIRRCNGCHGSATVKCTRCSGKGRFRARTGYTGRVFKTPVYELVDCPACNTTGKVDCSRCGTVYECASCKRWWEIEVARCASCDAKAALPDEPAAPPGARDQAGSGAPADDARALPPSTIHALRGFEVCPKCKGHGEYQKTGKCPRCDKGSIPCPDCSK